MDLSGPTLARTILDNPCAYSRGAVHWAESQVAESQVAESQVAESQVAEEATPQPLLHAPGVLREAGRQAPGAAASVC
jgi:hypothetical protein